MSKKNIKKTNITEITREMVAELNEELAKQGCVFKLEFQYYMNDPIMGIGVIYPVVKNEKFIYSRYEISVNAEGWKFIENFLATKGVEGLQGLACSRTWRMACRRDGICY